VFNGVVVNKAIDFAGCNSGDNLWPQVIHELGIEATGTSHAVALGFSELKLA
jgi:hypothetical protein